MTDDELERRLGRFHPANPSLALRARIVASTDTPRRVPMGRVDWALVTAALVLIAAAYATRAPIPPASTEAIAREQAVQAISQALGGDAAARQLAESLVPRPDEIGSQREGEMR